MNDKLFQENYAILNDAQLKAVEWIYGPIMVVAWPWTGKTQIIALRSANILKKTDVNPENILITTFTEAWVIAIKKRLQKFRDPSFLRGLRTRASFWSLFLLSQFRCVLAIHYNKPWGTSFAEVDLVK